MDPIDKVIIDRLKCINFPMEEIENFADFSDEKYMESLTYCLKLINSDLKLPTSLPKSMIQRLKLAVMLTNCLKNNLNYPHKIEYQNLIYFEENDARKLLMFLVDKLPGINEKSQKQTPLSRDNIGKETRTNSDYENDDKNLQIKSKDQMKDDLRVEISELNDRLQKVCQEKNLTEKDLNATLNMVKVKSQTLNILENKEEKLQKLRNIVQNDEQRLHKLKENWAEIEEPLMQQLKELQDQHVDENIQLVTQLEELQERKQDLSEQLNEKHARFLNLQEESVKWSSMADRSTYTAKIMEIINNLRKQAKEIDKILADTRVVQKDVTQLESQLHRLFTLCDEILFNDAAKNNQIAKTCHNLLVALHSDCAVIYNTIKCIGASQRSILDLNEKIDQQKRDNISKKLAKAVQDLEQFHLESSNCFN